MYEIVGRYRDLWFVFDTDDNSCELIDNMDLLKSGLVYKEAEKNIRSIHKYVTLGGFKSVGYDGVFGRALFSKFVNTTKYTGKQSEMEVNISLLALRCDMLYLDTDTFNVIQRFGYFGDYLALLLIEVDRGRVIKSVIDSFEINSKYSELRHYLKALDLQGVVLPPEMLMYIINLANNGKQTEILKAFGNLFYMNLLNIGMSVFPLLQKG